MNLILRFLPLNFLFNNYLSADLKCVLYFPYTTNNLIPIEKCIICTLCTDKPMFMNAISILDKKADKCLIETIQKYTDQCSTYPIKKREEKNNLQDHFLYHQIGIPKTVLTVVLRVPNRNSNWRIKILLPTPNEAKAKEMPGRLYTHT